MHHSFHNPFHVDISLTLCFCIHLFNLFLSALCMSQWAWLLGLK